MLRMGVRRDDRLACLARRPALHCRATRPAILDRHRTASLERSRLGRRARNRARVRPSALISRHLRAAGRRGPGEHLVPPHCHADNQQHQGQRCQPDR
jgi:hypothetical protein